MISKIKLCKDCGPLPVNHLHNWLGDFSHLILQAAIGKYIPAEIFWRLDQSLYKLLIAVRLLRRTKIIDREKTSLRTTVFLDEAEKCGIPYCGLKSYFGPINHFEIKIAGCSYFFEGLPRAEKKETKISRDIDDKSAVKKILQSAGLPTPKGKSFWWFQKNFSAQWAIQNLKFPLVVKPRLGSMSQHLTLEIQNEPELKEAIDKTICYSPAFLIEKFLKETVVYRATVIDFDRVACVKRIPAHVTGNDKNTVAELIAIKNQDPRRGNPRQKDTTLYKLVFNEDSEKLLKEQGCGLNSIPPKNKIVFLQQKIILDLGADLNEETKKIHPDNLKLFQEVARLFNTRLVGIDFLIKDIALSWKSNPCSILELNSLPYIDMHHFPTEGTPVNVAAALCNLVKKYY